MSLEISLSLGFYLNMAWHVTAFSDVVKSSSLKSGNHQAFTIQPECTKKSKSFTHFEESICFHSISHANMLGQSTIKFQDSTYLTELSDCLPLQRTSVLHGFPQDSLFND